MTPPVRVELYKPIQGRFLPSFIADVTQETRLPVEESEMVDRTRAMKWRQTLIGID